LIATLLLIKYSQLIILLILSIFCCCSRCIFHISTTAVYTPVQ